MSGVLGHDSALSGNRIKVETSLCLDRYISPHSAVEKIIFSHIFVPGQTKEPFAIRNEWCFRPRFCTVRLYSNNKMMHLFIFTLRIKGLKHLSSFLKHNTIIGLIDFFCAFYLLVYLITLLLKSHKHFNCWFRLIYTSPENTVVPNSRNTEEIPTSAYEYLLPVRRKRPH